MRHNDWLGRLDTYLASILRTPYHKVDFNCAHFILGAISAVTGREQITILRTLNAEFPRTELGVARFLLERGDMSGIARDFFGKEPALSMLLARRGDIALVKGDDGDALGVVYEGIVALSPTGLTTFKLSDGLGFWGVA